MCTSPQLLKKYSFSPSSARCIRGGGGHVLVLDACGRVHVCGWNNRGQLGLNSTRDCHSEFQCIPSDFFNDEPVDSIACGWDISGCITANRQLFVWGSNSFQQLGICQRAFAAVRRPLPVKLPRGDAPRSISFGLRHCAILSEDYKVFIFGRLRINDPPPAQLIITSTSLNRANVLKIQPDEQEELRINSVVSGQNHLILNVQDLEYGGGLRRIIAIGDNKFGQANAFQFEEDIKQMSIGWTHNGVLTADKRMFLWGRNSYGQLGTGSFTEYQPIPQELKLPGGVVVEQIHLGSEHVLALTTDGSIYTWGWNEHGNCGNESTENVCNPSLVDLPAPCKLAGTGAGFCYVIIG